MKLGYLALLVGSLAYEIADPNCDSGILGSAACCASECGTCGGSGCGDLPGGSPECCEGKISESGRTCGANSAPCTLDESFEICTVASGTAYTLATVVETHLDTALGDCCDLCSITTFADGTNCSFFHADAANTTCYLHNDNAPDYQAESPSASSGFVGYTPTPPTPPVADVDVVVDTESLLSRTQENFLCWNMDASRNRQFFDRNLSQSGALGKQLSQQAAALGDAQRAGFSWLRFGGSGNDYLTYAFNGTVCPAQTDSTECLNETTWTELLDFTEAARAKIIFGLSMNTGEDRRRELREAVGAGSNPPWDPSNAREILAWTIAQGRDGLIGGFELGNEQNTVYTAQEMADNFAVLWDLVQELWPDSEGRPALFGPDPHSCKQDGCETDKLQWIGDFINFTLSQGVPLYAATHHEYIEVDDSTWTSPEKLDVGEDIAVDINRTVATFSAPFDGTYVLRVAGEIGPHNGGSPPCDHSSMRWAVFGDSLWYADSLALKAKHGYDLHCRQDFIGADYGLCDCSTGLPLPDFYTALAWAQTMGPGVLRASIETANASAVRAYAHCSPAGDGGVTALIVNLAAEAVNLTLFKEDGTSGLAGAGTEQRRVVWSLEGSQFANTSITGGIGLASTAVTLNDDLLALDAQGNVPAMAGVTETRDSASKVTVAAESVTFVTFPDASATACVS